MGEGEIKDLKASNSKRKSRVKDLEDIVRSDRKTMVELSQRIQSLESNFGELVDEEEQFTSTTLAKAEWNIKKLIESQTVFLKETERRKDTLRSRVAKLGIDMAPPKPKRNYEEEEEAEKKKNIEVPHEDDLSNNEVAEKAMASAMGTLYPYAQEISEETSF